MNPARPPRSFRFRIARPAESTPLALALALAASACSGAQTHATEPHANAARDASNPDATAQATGATEPPASGCNPEQPSFRGFTTDDTALASALQMASTRNDPPPHPPGDTVELAEGYVRVTLPAVWFPRQVDDEPGLYSINTGYADDAFVLYVGDAPPYRAHEGPEFRLALGPVAVRGALWADGPVQSAQALALLPCAAPRYVYAFARTADPDRLAEMFATLRSLRVEREQRWNYRPAQLDAARDRDAVRALAGDSALARQLFEHSLAGEGLWSRYPLDVARHPFADQLLAGRFDLDLGGGAHARVFARMPVRDGAARAPALFGALFDGTLATAVGGLTRAGCTVESLQVGDDGVAVHCAGERELRAVAPSSDEATALPRALERAGRVRETLARWQADPAVAGAWPASLCTGDPINVWAGEGATLYADSEACALSLAADHPAVNALAVQGECAELPDEPWAAPVRDVGRFDEVRGEGGTFCRYTLGWGGRSSWVIAAGDAGTASGPIARGPTVAVDRRAVNTAVAFLHDLLQYLLRRADEPPSNVRPSVLASIGADRPGSPEAQRTLEKFLSRGGLAGPGPTAVLSARTLDETHVEVTFMPAVVTLEQSSDWVITGVRVGEASAAAAPDAHPGHGGRSGHGARGGNRGRGGSHGRH